ncbi:MAG TPA: hypothetical protein VJ501_07205, partial [Burkholderiaceae bacterium]|nr:hypothetical protein [Burkholderiaceae bacterium]
QRRLLAPAGLTNFQREMWTATVNSRPASWFGEEHCPMLLQYVRHIETANILAQRIDEFNVEAIGDPDQLQVYERLLRMQANQSTMINRLAQSMRMTQLSVHQAHKRVPEKEAESERTPWRKAA